MTQERRDDEILAQDGQRARDNGAWGKEKLEFLTHFGPVALRATESKHTRHYVDLFAGPGVNKVRGGREEFDGSPLRALELHPDGESSIHFTHAWFVNRDRRDHAALRKRVEQRIAAHRSLLDSNHIRCIRGDANEEVFGILESAHPKSYLFVFADITAPKQLPWTTVEALRRHREHKSVDLYMLFPLDMALKRLLSHNTVTREACGPVLTSFYGTERWRDLVPLRAVDSEANRAKIGNLLLDLYLTELRRMWTYVDVALDIRRGTHHRLYKMVFATNSDVGKKIGSWAKRRAKKQFEIGLDL